MPRAVPGSTIRGGHEEIKVRDAGAAWDWVAIHWGSAIGSGQTLAIVVRLVRRMREVVVAVMVGASGTCRGCE